MDNKDNQPKKIDLKVLLPILWKCKKKFYVLWGIVFVLSCLWVLPKPRYYSADISLAPETGGTDVGGGLVSLASSFGFNLGGSGTDAIYPMLYPDLFKSTEFLCELLTIEVKSEELDTPIDYYSYLKKYQKKNWLLAPLKSCISWVKRLFITPKGGSVDDPSQLNPFHLSPDDFGIVENLKTKISCNHDKKNDIITIAVEDQDPYVAACLADSVCHRLQAFITYYRTSKARLDVDYYQALSDSALIDYEAAIRDYSEYKDANRNASSQFSLSKLDQLQSDLNLKQSTYQAYQTQLMAMKSKVQEKTPAFTILRSATVPIKPAGPKRMLFIVGMLILSSVIMSMYQLRKIIFNLD